MPGRRSFATAQLETYRANYEFKKVWLSDPSTYPVIAIMGVALVGCSYFMANKFATDPAIRFTSYTKGKVIRSW